MEEMSHHELVSDLADRCREFDARMVISNVGIGSRWLQSSIPIPDVMMIKKSYTKPDITIYEVKATRRDFMQDVGKGKYRQYFNICHRFYFACPVGVLKKEEIPEGAGLTVYNKDKKSWSIVKASRRWEGNLDQIDWMSIMFALKESQTRVRRLSERVVFEENVDLEQRAKRLPSEFRRILEDHRTAYKALKEREESIRNILKLDERSGWYEIERVIERLVKKEPWDAGEDVQFALDILRLAADNKHPKGKWWLEKLEKYGKLISGRE